VDEHPRDSCQRDETADRRGLRCEAGTMALADPDLPRGRFPARCRERDTEFDLTTGVSKHWQTSISREIDWTTRAIVRLTASCASPSTEGLSHRSKERYLSNEVLREVLPVLCTTVGIPDGEPIDVSGQILDSKMEEELVAILKLQRKLWLVLQRRRTPTCLSAEDEVTVSDRDRPLTTIHDADSQDGRAVQSLQPEGNPNSMPIPSERKVAEIGGQSGAIQSKQEGRKPVHGRHLTRTASRSLLLVPPVCGSESCSQAGSILSRRERDDGRARWRFELSAHLAVA
jgi:hypothetical protein